MSISEVWKLVRLLWRTQLGKLVYGAIRHLLAEKADPWVDEMADLAKAKVLEVERRYPSGHGPQKKDEVLQFLVAHAQARGFQIGTSVLNFLIESAVQALDDMAS